MNIFDKRIIGAATLTAAAIGLLGVTAYMRRFDEAPDPFDGHGPAVALGRSFAMTPHASPVAPTTGADLAITAGESAWIHVPFGSVDIEIQSKCNAEVVVSVVTAIMLKPGARADDPPTVSTESKGGIIVGTHSPDGRASTYHLTPGLAAGDGMYEYTSRCVGQPPIRGNLVVDRVDANEPIGPTTNARVEALIVNEDTSVFQTPFDSLLANLPDLIGSMHAKSVFVLDDKRSVVPGGYLSQRSEKEGIAFRDWFEKEIAPKLDLAPPNVLNHDYGTWGDKDYFFSFMKKQSDDRTYYVVIEEDMTKHGIVVFGGVLPGARVSIGANPVALGPADPTWDDLPIYSKFATDVPASSDHLVAAVRVDDAKGTHFYVFHASRLKGSSRARPR